MLASLMRYLSPTTFAEAMGGKPLPPGVFESVFGVGGTPPRANTPRGARTKAGGASQPTTPRPFSAGGAPDGGLPLPFPFPSPSAADAKLDSPRSQQPHSLRPHSGDGVGSGAFGRVLSSGGARSPDGTNSPTHAGGGSSPLSGALSGLHSAHGIGVGGSGPLLLTPRQLEALLTAHRLQQDCLSFPTEEELSGLCQDGTTSFEFFLPADGEYLLEVFVADLVQLAPGNEAHCVELSASTFVPFVATAAEEEDAAGADDDGRAAGGDGEGAGSDDDEESDEDDDADNE